MKKPSRVVQIAVAAVEPVMDDLIALEKRVEKMALALAALEGRMDQVTRTLEIRGEHAQPARAAPLAGVKTA